MSDKHICMLWVDFIKILSPMLFMLTRQYYFIGGRKTSKNTFILKTIVLHLCLLFILLFLEEFRNG